METTGTWFSKVFCFLISSCVSTAADEKAKCFRKPGSSCFHTFLCCRGGHTMEMIRLLSGLTERYHPRHYIVASSDQFSDTKIEEFELRRSFSTDVDKAYKVYHILRSREVGQSYLSSIFSTVYACFCCFPLVRRIHPDVILCNGPGICVPVAFVGLVLKYLFLMDVTIVYVESICRVKTLSLSAKLLYPFIDHLLVQWPQLKERYSGVDFLGQLV